jgi:hypothetical protein
LVDALCENSEDGESRDTVTYLLSEWVESVVGDSALDKVESFGIESKHVGVGVGECIGVSNEKNEA